MHWQGVWLRIVHTFISAHLTGPIPQVHLPATSAPHSRTPRPVVDTFPPRPPLIPPPLTYVLLRLLLCEADQ